MEPTEDKHWDSEEFNLSIASANIAPTLELLVQFLRSAQNLAEREAPPGTTTAGRTHLKPAVVKVPIDMIEKRVAVGILFYTINLEGLRRFLDKHKDMPVDAGLDQFRA